MNRNTSFGIALFSVAFVIYCCVYYSGFLFEWPYGIHDQAQADRLSIAIQYYDRGMNFFLPRTYHIYATDGIVPVEFPIQAYIAALMGKLFGRESISTSFRLLTLFTGYLGMLSLYLIVLRATKDIIASLFIPFLLLSSPVFAYYLCNYLPDAAAVSVSFTGFYFATRYYDSRKFKHLAYSITLLTLATLIKTSVGVVLLSVMGYTLADMLFFTKTRNRKNLVKTGLLFLGGLLVLVGYNLYCRHLAGAYHGVLFTMQIHPFETPDDRRLYFTYCLAVKFVNEYFTVMHYPFLALLLFTGSTILFLNQARRPFFLLIALLWAGSFSLNMLFGQQLIHHNYYFVSIWLPTIIITLLFCFIEIRNLFSTGRGLLVFNGFVICLLLVLLFSGNRYFNKMRTLDEQLYPSIKAQTTDYWFKNGDKLLSSIGIGKDSTIALLDETAPNLGLLYFNRRGIHITPDSWRGNIFNARNYMKDRDIRIMVCNAAKMPEIETTYAQHFSGHFKELYRDNRCAVYYLTH